MKPDALSVLRSTLCFIFYTYTYIYIHDHVFHVMRVCVFDRVGMNMYRRLEGGRMGWVKEFSGSPWDEPTLC